MADGRPRRAEDEVRRQVGEQSSHRLRDGRVPLSGGVRLVQHGVLSIKLADRHNAPSGVALVEYARKIRLHQAVVVDGFRLGMIAHVLPFSFRSNSVLAYPITSPPIGDLRSSQT